VTERGALIAAGRPGFRRWLLTAWQRGWGPQLVTMAKKSRGKAGRAGGGGGSNPNKRAERQTRKALRSQRRGKNYSDSDLKSFNHALADSGLVLREMQGDGNCFFRAISDQLEGTQHNHATYRDQVCNHMEEMRDFYLPFIEDEDESFDEYLSRMRSDCEWVSA
jgi:hypothetical protein